MNGQPDHVKPRRAGQKKTGGAYDDAARHAYRVRESVPGSSVELSPDLASREIAWPGVRRFTPSLHLASPAPLYGEVGSMMLRARSLSYGSCPRMEPPGQIVLCTFT